MKNKVIIAYENRSSTTTRMTPGDVGVLLSKCDHEQLAEVLDAFKTEICMFKSAKNCKSLSAVLRDFAILIEYEVGDK